MELKLLSKTYKQFSLLHIEGDDAPLEISDTILFFLKAIDIKGRAVIDGGSNIGLYAMKFATMIGKFGKVFSFEVQPEIEKIARMNYANNVFKSNIISFNCAVSNVSGEMVGFTDIDYYGDKMSSAGIKTEPLLASESKKVTTIAIDDLIIQNVGLIKLDIEGYEPKALEGLWKTIERDKPYLIIELSDGYLGKEIVADTIEKIESRGYYYLSDKSFNYFFIPLKKE